MPYEYIASDQNNALVPGTESPTFDECVDKVLKQQTKSWEWLTAHGYTCDRYDESPIRSPLGSKYE